MQKAQKDTGPGPLRLGSAQAPFDSACATPFGLACAALAAGWVLLFARCRRAAATAIGAASVTLMSLGGFALTSDHIHLVYQRDTLKAATDAASLAATRHWQQALGHLTDDDDIKTALQPVVRRYILANIPEGRRENAERTLRFQTTLHHSVPVRVDIEATADLSGGLIFTGWMLNDDTAETLKTTKVETRTERSGNTIEIVLAMDITTSMAATYIRGADKSDPDNIRMNIAKTATFALLDALEGDNNNAGGHVAVGLVPFTTTVNIGSGRTAWMTSTDAPHKVFPARFGPWRGCIEHRPVSGTTVTASDVDVSLALPSVSSFTRWFAPNTLDYRPATRQSHRQRYQPYDQETFRDGKTWKGRNDWVPAGETPAVDSEGPHFGCPSTAIMPLTTDIGSVITAVQDLDAWRGSGGTMNHLGIVWGRRLLAPEWRTAWGDTRFPVDRGNAENKKVIVLLTDGLNTAPDNTNTYPGLLGWGSEFSYTSYTSAYTGLGRAGGGGNSGTEAEGFRSNGRFGSVLSDNSAKVLLNNLLSHSCTFAKDEGIEVFTVALVPANNPQAGALRTILTNCASSEEHAFTRTTSPEEITEVFQQIAHRVQSFRRVH